MDSKPTIEVILSPALYQHHRNTEAVVVVVDILRATSAICAAFENGVEQIIPVPDLDEARRYKEQGYIVAAERDGKILDFADFGNSPLHFTAGRVHGQKVAYSTTNGARTIRMASESKMVIIASFVNLAAVSNLLIRKKSDVLILCAGWKGKFCLEDTLFAGALADKLLNSETFTSDCDSLKASIDLWNMAERDIMGYMEKAMQTERLRKLGRADSLEYCYTPDTSSTIPVYKDGTIIRFNKLKHPE